jgi:regulator of protease activity HflC (stomatin/prohibitin superfamily)
MGEFLLPAVAGVVLYLLSGLRVLREYERAVYFFLGRSWGAKGPGLIFLPPLFAKMQKVSLRVMALDIPPQSAIRSATSCQSRSMTLGSRRSRTSLDRCGLSV